VDPADCVKLGQFLGCCNSTMVLSLNTANRLAAIPGANTFATVTADAAVSKENHDGGEP
jgi:hypothetical protein